MALNLSKEDQSPVPVPETKIDEITKVQNHTILTEHEIDIEDVTLRESREYSDQTSLTGQHFRTVFVHTRAIRDRIMQRKEVRVGGEVVHATINTTLEDDEVAQFESDWAMLWKPAITQQQLTNIESKAVDFRTEDDAIVPGSSCNNKSLQLEGGDKKAITHNP